MDASTNKAITYFTCLTFPGTGYLKTACIQV